MQQPTPIWPRGLLAGALLAVLLIIPVFVVMLFDSAAGSLQAGSPGAPHFALFQRPVQMQAHSAFFAGRLAVQAVLSQRFGPLPRTGQDESAADRRDLLTDDPAPEVARSTVMRLRLENRSGENLAVDIVRVVSSLGEFRGEPDRVILAPHQSTSLDSLVPDQKISAKALPVAVALRVDGRVETQKLLLNEHILAQARN